MDRVGPPAEMRLFNTSSRAVEPLQPLQPGAIALYCCGPTVYNYQHIGNLRTYIFEDLLVRTLRYAGYAVKHVMNITDVGHLVSDADEGQDKMLLAAQREGKKSEEIAQFYTDVFFDHCSWLNIIRPDVVCRATDHIPQMLELIKRLEENGYAYQSAGNVYFDVSRYADYGKLARLDLEQLRAGARIEVDANKRNALDFALWFTNSKFENQELQWDSPWGRGYPGWHIECSAMAMHYLGDSFDIHCGGIDHIPVHHTNEIAQSECATGKVFSRCWMHGGFLVVGKDKMAKSTGGFLTLDKVRERGFDPLSFRLFCLSGSYRNELSWSWEALESANNSLKRLKNSVLAWKAAEPAKAGPEGARVRAYREAFQTHCYSDLGMPNALAVLHEVVSDSALSGAEKLGLVLRFDSILGLGVESWQQETVPEEILALAGRREEARTARRWQEADALRAEIVERGYVIEDSAEGPKVKKH